ncbi:MAG: sigma 54-interacting transcriptional regulator [Planctomycetota bacterium]|nr:sigma 54-interacting transcriptional regulator [Planctomycetota bacterium]
MLTVTFYSFRGGVGRTMALANVAAHLARAGLNVFLIDFDLEAPGLSLMPEFRPAAPPARDEGLVGYLRAGLEDREPPPLPSLCYEAQLSAQIRAEQTRAGTIHLLPADARAGTDRQYDLARLHLEGLYETESRSLIIDALKVQIEEHYHPDYVLVDSRTGLTDTGGICTVHLADLLVIVSGLNNQNIEGTRLAVEKLQRARKDFADNVLFVISPVPVGEETLKADRLAVAGKRFAEAMGATRELTEEFLTVPYHPQLALSEASFVVGHPRSPLAQAFGRIAEAIRERNPGDAGTRFRRLMERIQRGEQNAISELFELAETPSAPRDVRMIAAVFHVQRQEYDRAARLLELTVERELGDHDALNIWGTVLSEQAKQKTEADGLFAQAGEKYAAALRIKPDKHQTLNSWGKLLLAQAKQKTSAEADGLFDRAEEKLLAAEKLAEGTAAYDLACVAALRGNPQGCRQWLERSRQAGKLPSREHLLADIDLDSVRTQPWFAELLASLGGKADSRSPLNKGISLREVMGPSAAIQDLVTRIERVAPSNFTVIISGETGVGKELVAMAIHGLSRRASGPFVAVYCGLISAILIESELFGHEQGAFTGADRRQAGCFEAAAGGTLFFDEIGLLPLAMQAKLLRALEERQIHRIGGTASINVDVRIAAATNENLGALVEAGKFRRDLFYRLNEFSVAIPPLRERPEDIIFLAQRFLDFTCAELRRQTCILTNEALDKLRAYSWPGNVRELRNVIRRAVQLAETSIGAEHVQLVP